MRSAAFKERQHLQEWLLNDPEIIEPDFYVLTSEFDKWQTPQGDKQSDRLDILGVDGVGRLVVVELKRGPCPDTTDMQAVKYAALSSQFTVGTLLHAHRAYLQGLGKEVTIDSLHNTLIAKSSGYDNLEAKVGVPRIILIAESFPSSVTSTAAFLSGIGLSIKLVQFQFTKFQSLADGTYTITFDTLFPPPGLESFISTPRAPTISQVVDQEVVEGEARQKNAVAQIIAAGSIPAGATLVFRPPYRIDGLEAWLGDNPQSATWETANPRQPLLYENKSYSPTGLARQIIERATLNEAPSLQGPICWTYEGRTLAELARTTVLAQPLDV